MIRISAQLDFKNVSSCTYSRDFALRLLVFLGACGLLWAPGQKGWAQPTADLSSTVFIDYFYLLDAPTGEREGDNGFTFRRLYLTTDFDISDAFSARARLEASDALVGSKGATPFVKDLYLRWEAGAGHRLTFGVMPPPSFNVSETVWGYRSLAKTFIDLFGVASSRDMGIRADGPLFGDGTARYALMLGNNEGTRPEDDRYKRVYGQLRFFPAEVLSFTLGADYAGYDDPVDSGLSLNGFAGYETGTFAAGIEGVWNRIDYTAEHAEDLTTGVSLFTRARVRPSWYVVGRYDRVYVETATTDAYENFGVAGVAYQPVPQVRFIPNVVIRWSDGAGTPTTMARVTLELDIET